MSARVYTINKQIREGFREICDLKVELDDARSLKDPALVRTLKRRLLSKQFLLRRNAMVYAKLDMEN